jgi:hypothetical protein
MVQTSNGRWKVSAQGKFNEHMGKFPNAAVAPPANPHSRTVVTGAETTVRLLLHFPASNHTERILNHTNPQYRYVLLFMPFLCSFCFARICFTLQSIPYITSMGQLIYSHVTHWLSHVPRSSFLLFVILQLTFYTDMTYLCNLFYSLQFYNLYLEMFYEGCVATKN